MLRRLRDYFDNETVLEVDTPALSLAAPSDVQIESLEVSSVLTDASLYLHTSPEFCMKRLLASGYPDIYSICRVFRDGESGRYHQPEFTMVEWYRLDYNLNDIIADTLNAVAAALNNLGPGLGDVSSNFASVGTMAKSVSIAAMLLGRLEIFTLLVLFTPTFWHR